MRVGRCLWCDRSSHQRGETSHLAANAEAEFLKHKKIGAHGADVIDITPHDMYEMTQLAAFICNPKCLFPNSAAKYERYMCISCVQGRATIHMCMTCDAEAQIRNHGALSGPRVAVLSHESRTIAVAEHLRSMRRCWYDMFRHRCTGGHRPRR
jgi:hypothetical protein